MQHLIAIELPSSLEKERNQFIEFLLNAQKKIDSFALQHQWQSHVNKGLINKVRIFSTKTAFDEALISAFQLEDNRIIPATAAAIIANDELLMVSPDVYSNIYPPGIEENSYEKLIIHELAHALHIRILDGDEEKMGPRWFYEGFAIHVANQFQAAKRHLTTKEICIIINLDKDTTYHDYKDVFDFLLKKVSIQELLEHSLKPNFIKWIKQFIDGDNEQAATAAQILG